MHKLRVMWCLGVRLSAFGSASPEPKAEGRCSVGRRIGGPVPAHSLLGRAADLIVVACLLVTGAATATAQSAQDDEAAFLRTGGGAEATPSTDPAAPGGPVDADDASFLQGAGAPPPLVEPPAEDPELALVEDPDKAYFLVGIRSHVIFIPGSLVEAFGLENFETVVGWALGPEFTFRRRGSDIVASIWWGSYPVETWTREKGDSPLETEIIRSTLGLVWFTVEFLSGYEFEPWVSLVYGGGFGVGITTGNVTRFEAYPHPVTGEWVACEGPERPPEQATYCERAGGHYGPVPRRADGIWPVYPMVTGKIGVRFKPLRNLVVTPEFGVGIPALFTLGLRANYMF